VPEAKSLATVKKEYDILDKKIECIREDRQKEIQSAPIPVPGLTFGDDGLLYNDIPLFQCSDGEKLMVSMRISMALNPKVRILRIKDGSLLGPKNLEILREMVKEEEYQLWLESVQGRDQYNKSGQVGIFIEEGVAEGDGVLNEVECESASKSKGSKKEAFIKSMKEHTEVAGKPEADEAW